MSKIMVAIIDIDVEQGYLEYQNSVLPMFEEMGIEVLAVDDAPKAIEGDSRNQRMVQGALIAFRLHCNRTSFACFTHDGSRHGIHRFTIHCNKRGKCH